MMAFGQCQILGRMHVEIGPSPVRRRLDADVQTRRAALADTRLNPDRADRVCCPFRPHEPVAGEIFLSALEGVGGEDILLRVQIGHANVVQVHFARRLAEAEVHGRPAWLSLKGRELKTHLLGASSKGQRLWAGRLVNPEEHAGANGPAIHDHTWRSEGIVYAHGQCATAGLKTEDQGDDQAEGRQDAQKEGFSAGVVNWERHRDGS